MGAQRTSGPRANALEGREIVTGAEATTGASADAVWEVLADLGSHGRWGGDGEATGLRSITAADGKAAVGSEFTSTGEDRMCRMSDRSVVTEATGARTLEFVTESQMELKRGGKAATWTVVHRYELEPRGSGCRVAYRNRVTRASALPGPLAMFKVPVLRSLATREATAIARRGVRNLVREAERRAGA